MQHRAQAFFAAAPITMILRAQRRQKLLPWGQGVAPWQAKLAKGQSDGFTVGTGVQTVSRPSNCF
ncbi:hypothetical protein P245_16495 [Comamonas thiooxydans]|uniref:Uncharacterized protein n=1 Tax=Comamonas thiooxydans TaxID=363952 RepID=A0A0E3C0G4_9BURK|nr:hypothetical protein P245_16495 [Comamonas thiooxydans]